MVAACKEAESAWKTDHQRVLVKLIDDTRQRRFQAVLARALDRLGREDASAILIPEHGLSACAVSEI